MKSGKRAACHSRIRFIWPVLLMVILISGSGGGAPASPGWLHFPHMDKVAHFFVFGLVATAVFRAFSAEIEIRRRAVYSVLLVSVFGMCDELRQGFNPNRTMDFFDWVADTGGAFVAVFVYVKWPFYRNLLETSFSIRRRNENRTGCSKDSGVAPADRPA